MVQYETNPLLKEFGLIIYRYRKMVLFGQGTLLLISLPSSAVCQFESFSFASHGDCIWVKRVHLIDCNYQVRIWSVCQQKHRSHSLSCKPCSQIFVRDFLITWLVFEGVSLSVFWQCLYAIYTYGVNCLLNSFVQRLVYVPLRR